MTDYDERAGNWAACMTEKYGPGVRDLETGRVLTWLQALIRSCYGPLVVDVIEEPQIEADLRVAGIWETCGFSEPWGEVLPNE